MHKEWNRFYIEIRLTMVYFDLCQILYHKFFSIDFNKFCCTIKCVLIIGFGVRFPITQTIVSLFFPLLLLLNTLLLRLLFFWSINQIYKCKYSYSHSYLSSFTLRFVNIHILMHFCNVVVVAQN